MEAVQGAAKGIICQYKIERNPKIGLIGHNKDESSYYLDMFPGWESENLELMLDINGTDVRSLYFEEGVIAREALPASSQKFLGEFLGSDEWAGLQAEFLDAKAYARSWASAPFPPTFMTVDAVVEHRGHILLVRRAHAPGKGQWAFPGGFSGCG